MKDHCTRYPIVDKGNSAQSTGRLSTYALQQKRDSGVWNESEAAHDQRSSSRTSTVGLHGHRHTGRSWYPPLVLTACSVQEELPGLLWTVSWRNSATVDTVHPQSGKFQTDRATVQSIRCILRRLSPGRTKRGTVLLLPNYCYCLFNSASKVKCSTTSGPVTFSFCHLQ